MKCETWNKDFSRRSRAVTAKKCTQKRDARAKLLFCQFNLLLFWRSRYRRPHRCLSFLFECLRWSHMTPSLKNSFRKTQEGREARTLHALLEAVRYPNNQEPWFCTVITTYSWGTLEIPNNHRTSHIFWSAYHHYRPLPGWFFYHLTQEIQFS